MSCCSIGPFKEARENEVLEELGPWRINVTTAFCCSVVGNVVALLAALIAKIGHLIQSYRLEHAKTTAQQNELKPIVNLWKKVSNGLLLLAIPVVGGAMCLLYSVSPLQ